jgi:hypothetical protein
LDDSQLDADVMREETAVATWFFKYQERWVVANGYSPLQEVVTSS